jgi:hypothetical protein
MDSLGSTLGIFSKLPVRPYLFQYFLLDKHSSLFIVKPVGGKSKEGPDNLIGRVNHTGVTARGPRINLKVALFGIEQEVSTFEESLFLPAYFYYRVFYHFQIHIHDNFIKYFARLPTLIVRDLQGSGGKTDFEIMK